eukprot:m.218934 g.218934  ORF g.218934 m.218934 type:complete len:122 (+) comp22257_c0_seq11:177-542(+)
MDFLSPPPPFFFFFVFLVWSSDFNKYVRRDVDYGRFAAALVRELGTALQLVRADAPRDVSSVFFGGGTPSLAPPQLVAAVLQSAAHVLQPGAEVTLEANPSSSSASSYSSFKAAGITRLSV